LLCQQEKTAIKYKDCFDITLQPQYKFCFKLLWDFINTRLQQSR